MPYKEKKPLTITRLESPFAWYSFDCLRIHVNQIESLHFEDPEDREAIHVLLNRIISSEIGSKSDFVFDTHVRFPLYETYVYIDAPKYIKSLTNLKRSLVQASAKSSQCEMSSKKQSNRDIFYDHLIKLKKDLTKGKDVYNRSLFEKRFCLKWTDK
ncbi:uncharacterized protein B0P05DRAFT_550294 [Gilbertella persicaria]|uniref:uncharacterized protein n=1 Tax=Gilbertella persicaria TaxID=101096 RepID=UPI00221FAE3E|nr:uncharacterized protein B0P05DRAFT_550294 [Gilbertella persicaria]KAI8070586.1 hypothetical protein B0P05DRAFT_550294 [Gilbertella persicaria]